MVNLPNPPSRLSSILKEWPKQSMGHSLYFPTPNGVFHGYRKKRVNRFTTLELGLLARFPIQKPEAFSHQVIASTWEMRGNLAVKGVVSKDEIASIPTQ